MKPTVIGTTGVITKQVWKSRGKYYARLFNDQVEVEPLADGVYVQVGNYRPAGNGKATPERSEPQMTPAERRMLNAQRTAEFIRQRKNGK